MSSSRRQGREAAMQVLFQIEVGKIDPAEALQSVIKKADLPGATQEFTRRLVFGTLEHQDYIDQIISKLSRGWTIERIANVDKTIMRMSLYEIIYEKDIPPSVSVNEAIELSKVFGGKESAKFVNGILGKVIENPDLYKTTLINEMQLTPTELQ